MYNNVNGVSCVLAATAAFQADGRYCHCEVNESMQCIDWLPKYFIKKNYLYRKYFPTKMLSQRVVNSK